MNNHKTSIGTKKRRLEPLTVSSQPKKVKLNTRPPFKANCNLLLEISPISDDLSQYEKYIHKIEDANYILVNKAINPNELISILKNVYKDNKSMKCNLIMDNYHSDFTKPFHCYKNIKIVKCLMSELILSPRYDVYNVKINNNMIDSIIPLIHSIKFAKRKTDFLYDFKNLFRNQELSNSKDFTNSIDVEVKYKSSNVQSLLTELIKKHKKQAIDTIRLKEKQVFDKLLKQKERRKRLEERKKMLLTKEKIKKPIVAEAKTPVQSPAVIPKENTATSEQQPIHVEKVPTQAAVSEPKEEILNEEELDKHALLTITKNMTSLTTLKKTKPYKIVKIFIRLPIQKFSTTIINELIASNKTSANIVMVSYINLQDTKMFFKNELKMKELGDSTEREFKVLAIGGGINDVLITFTDIRRNMMMKMAK